ncbi:MAG: HDIG domain-containing protein [Candidatus Krumholzibacteria bacterium]|nr:HDIG domain-containing protein [Candidatus Krumholzibacteria bacterium]
MQLLPWKTLRRKKNVSRNERAEKYSRHFRLTGDRYTELLPRVGLAVIFVIVALLLFPPSKRTQEVIFKAGEIADRNIVAPFDFEVPLSDDDLKIERASSALKVVPVYVRDASVEGALKADLTAVFDSLSAVVASESLATQQHIEIAASLLPFLSGNMVRKLVEPARLSAVEKAAVEFQEQIFARGFIDNASPIRRQAYSEISLVYNDSEKRLTVRDVVDQGRVDRVIKEAGFSRFQKDRASADVFFEVVRSHLLPNLVFDSAETEKRRAAAMSQVRETTRVSKNQRIIGKHDKVTAEQEKMLLALEQTRTAMETRKSPFIVVSLYSAEIVRLLLFGFLFGGYIFVFHRGVYRDMMKLSTVVTVMLIYMVFAAVVIRFALSTYLIPVAFVSLMMTALFDYRLGLVATVFACFAVPLVADISTLFVFVSLVAGTAGVVGLLRMRSRTHFYSVFLLISAAYAVGVVGVELGQIEKIRDLYQAVLWSMGNSLFSTLSAMFLLPIFEGIFNLTTRFTLLELTDLNKPILKRLNMEAPGTYHHSMLLGSLVDAVAAGIGADPLKARVMAYYHDIGKIFKPEYFVENQEAGFNKHEKITPQMSSLILLSHVKDGVELAREEKLPDLIIDAIRQHHGTTVMAFFYQKALETDSHSSVKKDDFRYPGPRPASKEAAALMLADTVEPACRSLKEPSQANIRNMVAKLIGSRAQDGELDESGLTLNDLAKIREKFVSILTGIYHKRVAYPGQEKGDDKQREAVAKPVGSK